ncbi:hypothetical protein BIU92_07035 [Curtobacterium sp. MCBA15_003]|nr:hypothetical protein BIU92_07035 [Curtobacterium sp. MCBA15_003]OII29326.1 hypothetical protein BIU94_12965 [Curtobacterium sp. MMLR14_006]
MVVMAWMASGIGVSSAVTSRICRVMRGSCRSAASVAATSCRVMTSWISAGPRATVPLPGSSWRADGRRMTSFRSLRVRAMSARFLTSM